MRISKDNDDAIDRSSLAYFDGMIRRADILSYRQFTLSVPDNDKGGVRLFHGFDKMGLGLERLMAVRLALQSPALARAVVAGKNPEEVIEPDDLAALNNNLAAVFGAAATGKDAPLTLTQVWRYLAAVTDLAQRRHDFAAGYPESFVWSCEADDPQAEFATLHDDPLTMGFPRLMTTFDRVLADHFKPGLAVTVAARPLGSLEDLKAAQGDIMYGGTSLSEIAGRSPRLN